MYILQAYQTANPCYKSAKKAKQVGILVHSTGAVNRELRRYVDAPERLGQNQYNNHWNKSTADKCMHGFVGYDKDKEVIVAHTLPYEYACWGCGKGSKGSYNRDPVAHIQFEICQGSNTDADYYWKAINVAAEYCAHLCREFGFGVSSICSHREAALAGYASNHGDPESWMKYFGDDMNKFRARVAALLNQDAPPAVDTGSETPGSTGSAPSTGGRPTIRKGDKGNAVKELQDALLRLGYALPVFGADGSFGTETYTAVKAFQKEAGLSADGICGPLTWAALDAMNALEDSSAGGSTAPEMPAVGSTPTVRKGDTGDAVKALQTALVWLGYALPKYGADGKFGDETRAAVKSFQKGNGLSADGICGPLTWAALLDALQEVGCDVSAYFGVSVG